MQSVTLRDLQPTDRAAWDPLWAGYLEFYKQTLAPEITEATWRRLVDPGQQLHGIAAFDTSGRMVGIVHYLFHPSTWTLSGYCYLEDLFVDPATRGLGVGRALIEAVYRVADERGIPRVYWHTENDNVRAQALYKQLATLSPFVQYRRK